MKLSNDLLTQFAKTVTKETNVKRETTLYGTITEQNGSKYVKIDGSDQVTPIFATVAVKDSDRVMVTIKNHTATVVGNMTSPSANASDVSSAVTKISELETLLADKVSTPELNTEIARIDTLEAENATIKSTLTATEADINKLQTNKLDTATAAITYANIDFSNIEKPTMESFYSTSGLIKDVTIGDGTITGELNGVTINGNLITGNTIAANKLVLQGEAGLYHKLNADGTKTEADQTEYNSLKGDIFMAKSIAATKIDVSDLVAFGATIGGFKITTDSIYSGVKENVENTTRGIYLGNDGQVALGDSNKYIKFFKDSNNEYKLLISGAVTANNNFKILEDGSMEATNGLFNGTINADNGSIGGISISGGELSSIVLDSDNIPTGFELKSDGSFISKGGANHDYVHTLEVKSGTLRLSSFYSPSGSNGQGAVLNASGLFLKEGNSEGEVLSSIYNNPADTNLYLKSARGDIILNASGFNFYFKENGMRIVFDGTNGKIWRVDTSGTWTTIAG